MPDPLPLDTASPAEVEALLDRAFGAGRHGRTAYRLRAGTVAIPEMSFAERSPDGALVGSIQCWPVGIVPDGGATRLPLVLVGPVAVEPAVQGTGIGRRLMAHALAEAGEDTPLMLIGDPLYYGRFGFSAEQTAGWRLPGPWEPHRLLARGRDVPASVHGTIEPWLPAPAQVA